MILRALENGLRHLRKTDNMERSHKIVKIMSWCQICESPTDTTPRNRQMNLSVCQLMGFEKIAVLSSLDINLMWYVV
jgi:hypothetical protein